MLRASKRHPAMSGVIDFNDPRQACRTTGFMPIHVAVANSLTNMVNFVIDLPGLTLEFDDLRAKPHSLTQLGRQPTFALLSPHTI